MPELEYVLYDKDEPVKGAATVTLNRPDKRNAMNSDVRDDIYAAFKAAIEDDEVRCIILRGKGDAFSAGGDLKSYSELDPVTMLDYNTYEGTGLYQWIAKCPKPTIAAIDGYAFGGGLEIALSFDFRIATEDSVFGLKEIEVGLYPASSPHRLVHMCGVTRTKEIVLQGRTFDAVEGVEWGIITESHSTKEAFDEAVADMAGDLVDRPPIAYRLAKKGIHRCLVTDSGYEPMAYEDLAVRFLFGTEDQKEGANAFLEDREPEFKGK